MKNNKGLTLIEVIISVTILTMVVLVFTVGMKSIVDMTMQEKAYTKLSSQAYSAATSGACSVSADSLAFVEQTIQVNKYICTASNGKQSVTYTYYKLK